MQSGQPTALKNRVWQRLISRPGTLFGLLLMVLVLLLNPFGLRDSSAQSTETWLLRMLAPFYPEKGQGEVVVVLIDDQALARMGASWPLPYRDQARLLRQLLSYRPKTLFVDLLYTQRRFDGGSTDGLRKTLASAREQGIPLILADYRDSQGRSRILPELAGQARTAQVNWSGYGERYPLVLEGASKEPRTPALQLYQAGCEGEACSLEPFQAPLVVRWGYWSDPRMARFADLAGCGVRGDRGNVAQLLRLLGADSIRAQLDAVDSERPQPCPYTRTLYANQLRDPRVAEVLRGKHVLLGVSIHGIPDLVASPVQGQLPGVYWHAMALDNLLSQDAGYWRDAPAVSGDFSWTDLLELALVCAATLVALLLPDAGGMPDRRKRFWCWLLSHYLFWFVVLSGIAAGASCLLMNWWHIAPLDWLGLTLAIGLFYAYLGEPKVADWWARRLDATHAKQGETGCSEPQ